MRLGARERLSFRSSGLPFFFGPNDGVEDCEELTEAGDYGDFFWPAALDEPLIGGLEDGIASGGDERGHVQNVANAGSSAADHAFASPCA